MNVLASCFVRRRRFVCGTVFFSLSKALARSKRKVAGSMRCTLRGLKISTPRLRPLGIFINPPLLRRFVGCTKFSGRATRGKVRCCERQCSRGKVCRGAICPNIRGALTRLGHHNCELTITSTGPAFCMARVVSRFGLDQCFRIVTKASLGKPGMAGSRIVRRTLREVDLSSRHSRIVVINSERRSVLKTEQYKVRYITMSCKCKDERRLRGTRPLRVMTSTSRLLGFFI